MTLLSPISAINPVGVAGGIVSRTPIKYICESFDPIYIFPFGPIAADDDWIWPDVV